MGLFDNIIDTNIECPYCGSKGSWSSSDIEVQTKSFDPCLDTYSVHMTQDNCYFCDEKGLLGILSRKEYEHTANKDLRKAYAIGSCGSSLCRYISRCKQLVDLDYISNSRRHFDIIYDVDEEGRVIDKREIIKLEEDENIAQLNDVFLSKIITLPEYSERWKEVLKLCQGNVVLAVLML